MNKKGFTLIEVLAVIVIIGILGGIAIIGVRSVVETGDEKYFNALESSILLAGQDYFTDHSDQLPTGNFYREVTLTDLVSNKYIEQPKDNKGNDCNNGSVYVYRENNKYAYEVCLTCGEYESEGTHCKEVSQRNINMRAWLKGTNTPYTLTTYTKAETTKNTNVIVEFSMDDRVAMIYKAVNTKTNEEKSCNRGDNTSCTVEIENSGTYKVTAYDLNNQIVATNQYFNVKIAKTGPQFSVVGINTVEGQQGFMMNETESVCKEGGNTKRVSFKVVKNNANEEYKYIKYRVIRVGEVANNIEYENATGLEISKALSSGKYQLEVVVANQANDESTQTYDFYVGYEMTLQYEDDNTTQVYQVVTGQNYNFIPNETLPTTKAVAEGGNVGVKWHPDNTTYSEANEITGETIVTDSCKYTIKGMVGERVTIPNDLTGAFCNTLTYNGSTQTLTKTIDGITFKKSDGTVPTGQNADTYNLIASINSPQYIWSDYTIREIPFTCTIGKATNPIAVTASQSWSTTFGTSAQDKSFTAATSAQGAVTYAIQSQKNSGGTAVSSFTIPTSSTALLRMAASTAVGTYTVVIRATAAGNGNYNSGYKDITMTVTVGKADPTCPTLSNNTKTYDGSAYSINITAPSTVNYSKLQYRQSTTASWSDTQNTQAAVGSKTVYVKAIGKTNYNDRECGSATITITAADPGMSLNKSTLTLTYGTDGTATITTPSDGTLSCTTSDSAVATCSVSGKTVTVTPKANTADGKTATITVSQAAGTNYKAATNKTIAVTVNRQSLTCPSSPANKSWTGSSISSGITCPTGSTAGGTQSATNAGSYSQTCTASSGYKFSSSCSVNWKIVKCANSTKVVTTGSTTATVEITVAIKNGTIASSTTSNGSISSCSISGTKVTCKVKDMSTTSYANSRSQCQTANPDKQVVYYSADKEGKRCYLRHGNGPNDQICDTTDTNPGKCGHCPASNTKYCTKGAPCIAGGKEHPSNNNSVWITKCYNNSDAKQSIKKAKVTVCVY